MNVEVENLPNCITTLRVEVPQEKVTATRNEIARDFARHVKLPGFRPGKAPRNVVETRFKKEIQEELTRKLLGEGTRQAISEKNLRVLSVQNVEDVNLGLDSGMRFTATLVTAPVFDLPEYKGLTVQIPPVDVTDEEADKAIENLREQYADFVELPERALQMDDFAVIDYTGTIDGQPVHEAVPKAGKPLSENTGFWIRLTPEAFFPGFSDQLLGAKPGDERIFDIQVRDDFPLDELRGKTIHYTVKITGARERRLPELNDEFAAQVAPGKTIAELRDLARTELRRQKEIDIERDKKNQIMAQLLSLVTCELPQSMVRNETRRMLEELVRENQARGVPEETLKENEKDLVGAASNSARDRLKGSFILLRIAEQEKITATEEELRLRIAAMAQRYSMTREKMREELEKRDALDQVREEILTGKVLDFLSANATVQTGSGGAA